MTDDDLTHAELRQLIGSCFQILLLTAALAMAVVLPLRDGIGQWLELYPKWVIWAVVISAAGFIVQMRQVQWQVRNRPVPYGCLADRWQPRERRAIPSAGVGLLQGAHEYFGV